MHHRRGLHVAAVLVLLTALGPAPARLTASSNWLSKLDPVLQQRTAAAGTSRVIVRVTSLSGLSPVLSLLRLLGVGVLRQLPLESSLVLELPNALLSTVAVNPLVAHMATDRVVAGAMERTGATIGAAAVRDELGLDGSGVGVAVIDSGVTPWHDDLAGPGGPAQGTERVDRFVDFVNGRQAAYDDYGHGTHVSGIIAGNGFDSSGGRTGIAPGAHLVSLKALDGRGEGRISDVIAAIDYAIANKDALNIRILNMSVATGVYESYTTDPLTLAAERAVDAGILVVAAAGNNGRGPDGTTQYGGITAPGNAPWVLTVGASSHMGTVDRSDDTMAAFSSRGPTAIDHRAKPDLVAPGVGIESLSDPASLFYTTDAPYLLAGTVATSYLPYLSLSGTSMATPVVSGTAALMLQANPSLTPNEIKAILQYTAQVYPGYDALTQGAGFLNAKGAVELAAYLAAPQTAAYPDTTGWGQQIIWGNHAVGGGRFTTDASAWPASVTWGDATTADGEPLVWGVRCATSACDAVTNDPWRTTDLDSLDNIVWGTTCGGGDCAMPWTTQVTATDDPEGDTVVWGTSDGEGDTVVWGTSCGDPSCRPVVWGGGS